MGGRAPGQAGVSSAINTLRAIARWYGPEIPVWLRVGCYQDSVVVDLADPARRVLVVTSTGTLLTTETPVRFYRPPGMLSLPVPVAGGSLGDVRDLWPVRDEDLVLVMGWLAGCFNPSGPKPVLDLTGTQGSRKSVLARMLRSVVDPNAIPLGTLPSDPRTLAVIVARHGVPAFDNVSVISDEISDALSRLASGIWFESRRLYTDDDLTTFVATRPVLLTGIPEVAKQPDLVDRTITIALAEFGLGERRTEDDILAAFEDIRPTLFGLLLDAVSSALANLPSTVLDVTPRMLDFATWVEAGAPAFGWEPGRFVAAYLRNRRAASIATIEGTVIGQFVEQLAETGFTGTAADCWNAVRGLHGSRVMSPVVSADGQPRPVDWLACCGVSSPRWPRPGSWWSSRTLRGSTDGGSSASTWPAVWRQMGVRSFRSPNLRPRYRSWSRTPFEPRARIRHGHQRGWWPWLWGRPEETGSSPSGR